MSLPSYILFYHWIHATNCNFFNVSHVCVPVHKNYHIKVWSTCLPNMYSQIWKSFITINFPKCVDAYKLDEMHPAESVTINTTEEIIN